MSINSQRRIRLVVGMSLWAVSVSGLVMTSVANTVELVFGVCAPVQILDSIVIADAVYMAGLQTIARADERLQHQPVDETSVRNPIPRQANLCVAPINRNAEESHLVRHGPTGMNARRRNDYTRDASNAPT